MLTPSRHCRASDALAVLLLAAAAGCGAEKGPQIGQVEGVVTLDGKPLANAAIIFKPVHGRESNAVTDSQGHYSLSYKPDTTGAIVGNHRVSISTKSEFQPKELVPTHYHHEDVPAVTVEPGDNSINFELKSSATTR